MNPKHAKLKAVSDYIKPYSDICIAWLFGAEENKGLLLSFLNSIQDFYQFPHLVEVEQLNPFNLQKAAYEKLSILDIKARDDSGRLYNIEVQTSEQPSYTERSLYYWAKMYAGQMDSADQYRKLRPAISINILNYERFSEFRPATSCFMLSHKDMPDLVLTDHIVMHYIELPKLMPTVPSSFFERWLAFLKYEGREDFDMKILLKDEPALEQAHQSYQYFSHDRAARMAYEDRQKFLLDQSSALYEAELKGKLEGELKGKLEGELKGKLEGELKGELKGRLEAATKFKNLGVPVETICAATGLSRDEVAKL